MITGALKHKIDSLWEMFWTGGLTNPLEVIEQMTYLMFIRDLDEYPTQDGSSMTWSDLAKLPPGDMYHRVQEQIFPFIRTLHGDKTGAYARYMADAIFKIPTPHLLQRIVVALDDIYRQTELPDKADTRGDVYEYMLSKLSTAGMNGQFRTPRHIIKLMIELMQPGLHDSICDPACGTCGFLVETCEYLKQASTNLHGYDTDRTMLRIGAMNMMLHGVNAPDIQYCDSLSTQNADADCYDLILANPPFKGQLAADIAHRDLQKSYSTKKTELLFIALFLRMLKVGGRCACIVPQGVLFATSNGHKAIRRALIDQHRVEAVISLHSSVFKPYAGVATAILIFTKTGTGGTDNVWFYDIQADGFSADHKRHPIEPNDIPDIISRYRNLPAEAQRLRSEQSFLVPKDEIIANDYNLSINQYKKREQSEDTPDEPLETVELIRSLQAEIDSTLNELAILLKK